MGLIPRDKPTPGMRVAIDGSRPKNAGPSVGAVPKAEGNGARFISRGRPSLASAAALGALAALALLAVVLPATATAQEPLDFSLNPEGSWETSQLAGPIAASDDNDVYQLDWSSSEGTVRQFTYGGGLLRSWEVKHGVDPAFTDVAVDPSTHAVYVAGRAQDRRSLVTRYSENGEFLGLRQLPAQYGIITGVGVNPRSGTVFIHSAFASDGKGHIIGFDFDTGQASVHLQTDRSDPADLAMDPSSGSGIGYVVYDALLQNHALLRRARLIRFSEAGPGDNGRLLQSVEPKGGNGVTVDNSNHAFVSSRLLDPAIGVDDRGVAKYAADLELQGEISLDGVATPTDLTINSIGTLYVSAPGQILRYDPVASCPFCAVPIDLPAQFVSSRGVNLSFAAPGATSAAGPTTAAFGCQLDRRGKRTRRERRLARWHECESPKRYERLRPGRYTFIVRGFDQRGEPQPTPERVSFTVDRRAPRTRIAGGPRGTIRKHRAGFKVRSNDEDASFECRLDGRRWRPCFAADGHALQVKSRQGIRYEGLKSGRHVLRVRAIDRAGNRDPSAAKRVFRVIGGDGGR